MLETPHAVVGAAIAARIPNPLISIPLALASHLILDRIPHWNPHLNTELKLYGKVTKKSTTIVAIDMVTSIILGSLIAYQAMPDTTQVAHILLVAFVAVAPDVIEGPYFFFGLKNKLIAKWLAFQKSIQVDTTVIPGLATQLATIIGAFLWVFQK